MRDLFEWAECCKRCRSVEGSGFVGDESETFRAGWVKNRCCVGEKPGAFLAGDVTEGCHGAAKVDVFVNEFVLGCFGAAAFHVKSGEEEVN